METMTETVTAVETDRVPVWLTLSNRHTGEVLRLRRTVSNGELCLELQGSLPAKQDGPPLHIHYLEHEEGRVISGTLSAEVDGRRFEIEAGGLARLPAGLPHRWWNDGDQPLTFGGVTKPLVDLDVYLHAVFEVLNSGPVNRPPLFYMAHVAWRHRKTQAVLVAPLWLQAVLVPVVVFVGTILGRYRGTAWPGCPARCVAAPLAADATAAPQTGRDAA
ncbi:MAG TPA: cupin domain-containing protein [Vicinamibacterales bacterium]|jgi:mannose-6-phosphate isomerase-like protein (cupin superfamily)